ncbi:unnamed protein product [Amoebophrya sp. A120]|nr:unnamed protein product [Amoebophrya sp. A120]|eukprot:GSA120T00025021001.1
MVCVDGYEDIPDITARPTLKYIVSAEAAVRHLLDTNPLITHDGPQLTITGLDAGRVHRTTGAYRNLRRTVARWSGGIKFYAKDDYENAPKKIDPLLTAQAPYTEIAARDDFDESGPWPIRHFDKVPFNLSMERTKMTQLELQRKFADKTAAAVKEYTSRKRQRVQEDPQSSQNSAGTQ